MPEEGVLSLQDLHHIISDIWLTRFDEDLEKERSARRKGRPKSLKEVKLEQLKLQEAELYRTGMGMQPPLKTVSPEN
jgi:translation machinery-associated protein 16